MSGQHAVIGYQFLMSGAFTDAKPTSIKVLAYLSWLASHQNPCKVSIIKLISQTGLSRPTVISALKELESIGAIRKLAGHRQVGMYKICSYPGKGSEGMSPFLEQSDNSHGASPDEDVVKNPDQKGRKLVKKPNPKGVNKFNPLIQHSVKVPNTDEIDTGAAKTALDFEWS